MSYHKIELTQEQKDMAFKRLCLMFLNRVKYAIDLKCYKNLYTWNFDDPDEQEYILHDIFDINYRGYGKYKGFEYGLVVGDFVREKLDESIEIDKALKVYACHRFERMFFFDGDSEGAINSYYNN